MKCLDRSHWYYCHIADSLRVISLIFWIQEKEKKHKRKSRMTQMTQYCQNWYSASPLVRQWEALLQPRERYNLEFYAILSESLCFWFRVSSFKVSMHRELKPSSSYHDATSLSDTKPKNIRFAFLSDQVVTSWSTFSIPSNLAELLFF